jgi:hypothetical protein
MNSCNDSTLTAAIAKAGLQQLNAIRYLMTPPSHQRFVFLNRLRKYGKYINESTYNQLIHGL